MAARHPWEEMRAVARAAAQQVDQAQQGEVPRAVYPALQLRLEFWGHQALAEEVVEVPVEAQPAMVQLAAAVPNHFLGTQPTLILFQVKHR